MRGSFVGISENIGHDVTFEILNAFTYKIISRSYVRPADNNKSPNLKADPLMSPEVIK